MSDRDTILSSIFKAYDIRGLVDEQLTPELVRDIGAAAVRVLGDGGEGAFVIGHDMRPSSEPLSRAFAEGVTSQGWDAVLIGLASTDMLYFASGDLGLPGAMFTASHNPAQYNGIKLCKAGAQPVSIDGGGSRIRDLVAAGGLEPTGSGDVRHEDVLGRFADHVRSFVDVESLRPVRLAVDAGNGMGGHVVPPVFGPLPFAVTELFFELDGTFPNHPANPIEEENLRDLQRVVREQGLQLGLAFDGDADRMFAVDETGQPVPSSLIGAVVAAKMLEKDPGATVLYNLICSRVVPETIEAAGGTAVRTRVGHSFIKERMAETGAVFGAEHSGHYYFRDNYRADSGLIAAVVLLEAVAEADAPLSEVVAPYAVYVPSGEINFEVDDQQAMIEAIEQHFADRARGTDREDGLTVQLDDGWFNVRPSNTEPLLRLNAEGRDHDAMVAIRDEVRSLITR